MVCGTKWKGCECQLFGDEAVARDRLEHLNGRPGAGWGDHGWGGERGIPGAWAEGWEVDFDDWGDNSNEERRRRRENERREQERRDEALARQLEEEFDLHQHQQHQRNARQNAPHPRNVQHNENAFVGVADINNGWDPAIGNAEPNHLNDHFRQRARDLLVSDFNNLNNHAADVLVSEIRNHGQALDAWDIHPERRGGGSGAAGEAAGHPTF